MAFFARSNLSIAKGNITAKTINIQNSISVKTVVLMVILTIEMLKV